MAEDRERRRLAAILAADVVGYSRLMESDEAGTLVRLKAIQSELFEPRTVQYDGRIFKTTGDGAFVEFGSAVDAVRSAIDIQRAIGRRSDDVAPDRRLEFRIGISLGDVIVDGEDLYGNGVNVAARMEGLAETGGICISGNVHEHVGSVLDVAFEDLGEQAVKNIDRPVRSYRVRLDDTGQASRPSPIEKTALPHGPSVAVLPFDNLSGDPEQEYFVDGLTEDIITALSRFRRLDIKARNSTFAYKNQAPDIHRVAEELSVGYVLEGSVRKGGDRLRVSAQLIDGATGNHIWAERYDRVLDDVFAVQDAITEAVIGAIEPEVTKAEITRARSKRPESLDAWDLYLQGTHLVNSRSVEDLAAAVSLFEQATELDPGFGPAYQGMSYAHCFLAIIDPETDRNARLADAERTSRIALRLDREDDQAQMAYARALALDGRLDEAMGFALEALRLNPGAAFNHYYLGRLYVWAGRSEEGVGFIENALRMSPRDIWISPFMVAMAEAQFALGNDEAAIEWADKALREPNALWFPAALRITALANLGRDEEARAAVVAFVSKFPHMTLSRIRSVSFQYTEPVIAARYFDGLRRAGLPEGQPDDEQTNPPALPDKPSIAVLPFDNLSGDPEQEYFSDGMAEDLITDLSKLSDLFVAARNASFAFKGRMPDMKEVANKLAVKFVLEGSVRKMGDRLRINAQLIDAVDGGHLWAERYDGSMDEIFEFQDRTRAEIVSTLELKLTPTDIARSDRRRTDSVEAYDHYLKARERYFRYTPEALAEAFSCLESAIELDANFADAYGYLSACCAQAHVFRWLQLDQPLDKALEAAERAVSLDPESVVAHTRLGFVQMWQRRYDEAAKCFEIAAVLGPEIAEVLVYQALLLIRIGNPNRALQLITKTLELDPFAPLTELHLGMVHLLLGRFEEAVANLETARDRTPRQLGVRLYLASAYVEVDRLVDAQREIEAVLEVSPDYTANWADTVFPYRIDQANGSFVENLLKAGLPEGTPIPSTPGDPPHSMA